MAIANILLEHEFDLTGENQLLNTAIRYALIDATDETSLLFLKLIDLGERIKEEYQNVNYPMEDYQSSNRRVTRTIKWYLSEQHRFHVPSNEDVSNINDSLDDVIKVYSDYCALNLRLSQELYNISAEIAKLEASNGRQVLIKNYERSVIRMHDKFREKRDEYGVCVKDYLEVLLNLYELYICRLEICTPPYMYTDLNMIT